MDYIYRILTINQKLISCNIVDVRFYIIIVNYKYINKVC